MHLVIISISPQYSQPSGHCDYLSRAAEFLLSCIMANHEQQIWNMGHFHLDHIIKHSYVYYILWTVL